jgi:DNA-binding transcriptional LysR family regulator
MKRQNLDLNLLSAFEAIYEEGNISRAAVRLNMSQPALSNALNRLRKFVDDPLFVRTSHGVTPTSRARQLAEPIIKALDLIQNSLNHYSEFNFKESEKIFQIAMSDYCETVMLPRLMDQLTQFAPNIQIKVQVIDTKTLSAKLASGQLDLAIGNLAFLADSIKRQRLFKEGFKCAASKDHPMVGDTMSLKEYSKCSHVVVKPKTKACFIGKKLAGKFAKRNVSLSVPNFLVVPAIIANTRLISILPNRIVKTHMNFYPIKIFDPPFSIEDVNINQYWHEQVHNDPAHKWFRQTIFELGQRL